MFKSILDILEMLEPRGAVRGMFGGISAALQSFRLAGTTNSLEILWMNLFAKTVHFIPTALAMFERITTLRKVLRKIFF